MPLLSALLPAALAYETDPLTDRAAPLADATSTLNAYVDELLDQAAATTNERTGCGADDAKTARVLAKQIYKVATAPTPARSNTGKRRQGHGHYAAWIEDADVDSLDFPAREDLFGGIPARRAYTLSRIGPCSTIEVCGVRVGTDKFQHFFSLGYKYTQQDTEADAIAWGTRTERYSFGTLTSRVFSYADLRANHDGYLFYAGLLDDESPLQRGADGCVERVAGWDWADWVDWEWDEALNPSVYAPYVQGWVDEQLWERRAEICEEYAAWGGGYEAHLDEALGRRPGYASGPMPAQGDSYKLRGLCE